VADIAYRLDGIPLALELAATRVPSLGLEGLAERLDDRLRLLVGGRTAARHQTLRATLDWSYELLGESERRLFARLAPFAGGWTLPDAEAVCAGAELPKEQVAERMLNLVDQSLVVVDQRPGRVRYRLMETMRQYAAERLSELGQGGAGYRRHRDHYLSQAERLPAERFDPGHLDWLAEEADNIRVALRWSIDQDEFEAGLRLADAMHGLWYVRGSMSEGRAWLTELLERAGPAAETALGGKSLGTISRLAFMQGDLATAARLAERSFQLAERLGDRRGLALVAVRRAVVARGQGDLVRARGLYQEALDRSRALADPDVQIFSLYGLSMTLLELDDREAAETLARECVAVAESVGHVWGLASAHRVLGRGAASRGCPRVARRHLEESLSLSRGLGYAQGVVYALTALGQLAVAEADTASARWRLCEALGLAQELGDRLELLHCLDGLGQIEGGCAHHEQAARLAGAAAALRDALGAAPYPREQDALAGWLPQVTVAMGEARFTECWIEGRTVKLDQLVAELLSERPESAPDGKTSGAAGGGGLTQRELEVASLVGQGLSTRAIAAQLGITEGTAKVHVTRILGKLELHSRAQLAVWAVQRGLVSAKR
jgi:DNA-binding CsgD family transcriptional regulator/tetratricopeptide (TPR) repeat protein